MLRKLEGKLEFESNVIRKIRSREAMRMKTYVISGVWQKVFSIAELRRGAVVSVKC